MIVRGERFGHREVEGELHEAEAVGVAPGLARKLEHAFERVVAARARRDAEAVPRRHAVEPESAPGALALQLLEGRAQTPLELLARDRLELRLRVVDVVHVHGLKAEVAERLRELVREVVRRHAVAPRHDVL